MHMLNNTTDHAQLTRQLRETVLSTRDIQEESFLNEESERKEEKKKMLIRSEDRTLKKQKQSEKQQRIIGKRKSTWE